VEVYASTGGGPNATALGADGYVYVTQNGGVVGPWRADDQLPGCIQRVDESGRVEVVATEVDGLPLRAPNDLAFGPDGRLYFTDPGGPYDPVGRPDPGRVFALGADGRGELVAEVGPAYPNGIVAEQDGSMVWVESYDGTMRRRALDGVVARFAAIRSGVAPDGLAVAADGDLYVTTTSSHGVHVLSREGAYRGFLPVGSVPTNCAFAGRTLYVTDGGHQGMSSVPGPRGVLWAVDLDVTGQALFYGQVPPLSSSPETGPQSAAPGDETPTPGGETPGL
jgi:gluconolactonase